VNFFDCQASARWKALAVVTGTDSTVLLTDVVGFGALHRSCLDRQVIRSEGLHIMRSTLGPLWGECISQDRGDGLFIVAPPAVPTAQIMTCLHQELPARLREHNQEHDEPTRIRLRVAANIGRVVVDAMGLSGEAILRADRLVEAPVMRQAMAESGASLGIMASQSAYDKVAGPAAAFAGAGEYMKVAVTNKEFRGSAWLRLVDPSPRAR
jgi:class 3 adenylate cyclase